MMNYKYTTEYHRNLITKFRRFPHRNKVLGKENTNEEIVFIDEL
jgi:uncharacterized protein (DUF924 family)